MAWWLHTRSKDGWLAPAYATHLTMEIMALFETLTGDCRFTASAIIPRVAFCAADACCTHTFWIERMSSIS